MSGENVSVSRTKTTGRIDLTVRGAVPHKQPDDFAAGQADIEQMPSSEGGGQRAYSPSSVSSATSTRPLEWDSGADVGYLLQNEERQLANAIKKLGLGLPSASRPDKDSKEKLYTSKKTSVDSLREEDSASAPVSESTPKPVDGLQKGASSIGGSRQTLHKTASSSSVATVVSKEADVTRSSDLINDLTKGLQLVKSLIAEAKGDKEKQGRLLAHVVKQLKTVEDGKHRNRTHRRSKKQHPESSTSSTVADSSSNSTDIVDKLKNTYLSHKLTASGDSTSTALESSVQSEVEACNKLLSAMPYPNDEKLVAWANSQERLLEYPPHPKLSNALDYTDVEFGQFLQDYINSEYQRQVCWRSDIVNLMSKRAELVKHKHDFKNTKETKSLSSTGQSSVQSDKVDLNPSNLFGFTINPSTKAKKLDLEPKAKIFQHTIQPSAKEKVATKLPKPDSYTTKPKEIDQVPPNLDAFLADPNKLTLFKPALIEKVKKMKTPTKRTKESLNKSIDVDLPLQEMLRKKKPNFIKKAESRRKCLALLGERRQQRGLMRRQCLKEQVDRYSGSLPDHIILDPLPPPPLAEYRLFTQQQLREQTERKYKKLEEIRKKEELKKREEELKTNRLMAQIFKRKLQNRVLHHKVDLSNSMSVITTED